MQEDDISLRDVVVATPGRIHGGVIQFDIGKIAQGKGLVRTGSLNALP